MTGLMQTGFGNAFANACDIASGTKTVKTENAAVKTSKEGTDKIILSKNDPDFDSMTTSQWATYEFHMDYATLFADITSYDHDFLRYMLGLHWSTYLGCTQPTSKLTEAERREALTTLHNARMRAVPLNDPESKRIYLWPRGKVPTITMYTENKESAFADDPGFEPFMLERLVDKDTKIKGAVVISAGGGHNFRSNVEEGLEVALALNALGYQCFILNYRVNPYTIDESALDVARAIRIVRANAEKYGIDKNRIACAGFSAGGSVTTAAINRFGGDQNASALVKDYAPDQLDVVSADINAYLSIYGNYEPDALDKTKFPPTFLAIGGEDGWQRVTKCFDSLRDAGIITEVHTFAGVPHGFGAGTGAGGTVYSNATTWTLLADSFMQDVFVKAQAIKETTGTR
jgi:acetyl esterase/lipase